VKENWDSNWLALPNRSESTWNCFLRALKDKQT
jgi:hypothetical protein